MLKKYSLIALAVLGPVLFYLALFGAGLLVKTSAEMMVFFGVLTVVTAIIIALQYQYSKEHTIVYFVISAFPSFGVAVTALLMIIESRLTDHQELGIASNVPLFLLLTIVVEGFVVGCSSFIPLPRLCGYLRFSIETLLLKPESSLAYELKFEFTQAWRVSRLFLLVFVVSYFSVHVLVGKDYVGGACLLLIFLLNNGLILREAKYLSILLDEAKGLEAVLTIWCGLWLSACLALILLGEQFAGVDAAGRTAGSLFGGGFLLIMQLLKAKIEKEST